MITGKILLRLSQLGPSCPAHTPLDCRLHTAMAVGLFPKSSGRKPDSHIITFHREWHQPSPKGMPPSSPDRGARKAKPLLPQPPSSPPH